MNSVSNSPLQTRIGFQQIHDAIFLNCFFAYLTPGDILRFGSTCRRIQLLAISKETINTIGIHHFKLNLSNNIELIVDKVADRLLEIKKVNSKKRNKKFTFFNKNRQNINNKRLIYKLSAGLTFVNLSVLWLSTRNFSQGLDRRFPTSPSNPLMDLTVGRLIDSYFSRANERLLSKDGLENFLKNVFLGIAITQLQLQLKEASVEPAFAEQAKFTLSFLKSEIDSPYALFSFNTETKVTLMLCLVKARERNNPKLNPKNSESVIDSIEKSLLPLTKAFDLCTVLETCQLLDPNMSAAVTNDLLLPDSLDIGEEILKEFADKYPDHPFSGRIRRAFREKEMRSKLGLIADIWNQANKLITTFLTPVKAF